MSPTESVLYDEPADHVARITLNRPEKRNAQDTSFLYQLNAAFDRAAIDDNVKVIVLASNGPHFSAGHDLMEPDPVGAMGQWRTVGTWCGFGCAGAESQMAREKELYLGLCERWRNIPKPTIAQVQGKCIAGGMMLAWPCDIIIASENASFQDNTVAMGVGGVEFFAHPWELGIRQAKEFLFTGGWLSARDAWRMGMVNHVVADDELAEFALGMARTISSRPMFALKLAKEALNAAQDAQGRVNAMQTAFALHQLAHSHNMQRFGMLVDPSGIPSIVKSGKLTGGRKDSP